MSYSGIVRGVPEIVEKTLTLADTWYPVKTNITQTRDVYKWIVKPKLSTLNDIDIAFEDSPSTHLSLGSGLEFDTNIPALYARSAVAGTVVELLIWYRY